MKSAKERYIQDEFKRCFNKNYQLSPDIKLKANEAYFLQFAIYKMSNQWLTKRFTFVSFGCGLDPALNTIIISRQFLNQQKQIVEDEEEIRKFMITYDLNDCLAVKKLVYELQSPTETESPTPLITYDLEAIFDDELAFDHEQEPVNKWPANEINYNKNVHVQNEIVKLYDDVKIDDAPTYDILTVSHDRDDSLKMIRDDDIDDIDDQDIGHARNDRQNDIEIISDEDEQQPLNINNKYQQHLSGKPLTRNQKKSRKKRAKRYRFQIIRKIYRGFTIRQFKMFYYI
ncbi:unnamed protein product [Rotaria sp. Silwood2]|nr:unnamed protein product [Rotaria sp. Silwood2]CAF3138584.1 unnamed protein product [Rotaria sp. Silwood2]CAF4054761.1 unnamed protein product [Rotaria sp. Silwood2]CAF4129885.1 unnamed protein product [Rotaria sp. Silwood2]